MKTLDRRLTPARPDLAAASLRGIVEAARFVEGETREVSAPTAPLRPRPEAGCGLDTEALFGERLTLFDEADGFAWVQLAGDGYVGYLPSQALRVPGAAPTHRVRTLRTFLYPGPSMKLPTSSVLPMGAQVTVTALEGAFAVTPDGCVWAAHLVALGDDAPDFVAVAEQFVGTPYLWGGKSSLGLDCSGLLQLALGMAGIAAPRDSDLQQAVGEAVGIQTDLSGLRRGDIVCWKGHVGMMTDADTLLHATGNSMLVVVEPLRTVVDRIAAVTGLPVAAIRRLSSLGQRTD